MISALMELITHIAGIETGYLSKEINILGLESSQRNIEEAQRLVIKALVSKAYP